MPSPRLRIYEVHVIDEEKMTYVDQGRVLLPQGATGRQVAHALAAVGVYAPRGADELHWTQRGYGGLPRRAVIVDGDGKLIVHLIGAEPRREKKHG